MELDAKTLYDMTFDELMFTQKRMLEFKALYIETKKELEELRSGLELRDN